ncbi:hypothetical protein [Pinibacter soli]|uniref:Uncharacterized protein n=1 Tax=Pinibacter soli TaxID=3044211 RepID=A0ABT6R752_9BACT|nr:hypothetical protein [Pinibacter soli]MDI3318394.1 hypothetical protein [Pinibacter soli]
MSFGKKILSAFVEVNDNEKKEQEPGHNNTAVQTKSPRQPSQEPASAESVEKFRQYFDKLFSDSNFPGPDYFEFFKMVDAMKSIADEKARFTTAFAGLSVQGLDKTQLLSSAQKYIDILKADAQNFNSTVDTTIKDKIASKRTEIENNNQKIKQMQNEIQDLENRTRLLTGEIEENETKLNNSTAGYNSESQNMLNKINLDIEKIKQYI